MTRDEWLAECAKVDLRREGFAESLIWNVRVYPKEAREAAEKRYPYPPEPREPREPAVWYYDDEKYRLVDGTLETWELGMWRPYSRNGWVGFIVALTRVSEADGTTYAPQPKEGTP